MVWFAVTADRQYVKYVAELPPGEAREDMLTWRFFPLSLAVSVAAVGAAAAVREIRA